MNYEQEYNRLLEAIRKHRDQRADDRCWLDDIELYKELPEGVADADLRLPPPLEMMSNCLRYIGCRQNPDETYVSSQREIERLETQVAKLQAMLDGTWDQRTKSIKEE